MKKIFALCFLLSVTGCDDLKDEVATLSGDQQKSLVELAPILKNEATLISACNSDDDCVTTGFTPKLCGGYSDFLPISMSSNRNSELTEERPSDDYFTLYSRIYAYRSRYKAQLVQAGNVGLCDVQEGPPSFCNADNKCALQE